MDAAAKFRDFFEDYFHGFGNDDFFAGNERKNGVGRPLYEFDEVRIDDEELIVEASELDHERDALYADFIADIALQFDGLSAALCEI